MMKSILIKNTLTKEIREISHGMWEIMRNDGRSRRYTVIPSDYKPYVEPEHEEDKIEIKDVFSKRKKKETKVEPKNEKVNES